MAEDKKNNLFLKFCLGFRIPLCLALEFHYGGGEVWFRYLVGETVVGGYTSRHTEQSGTITTSKRQYDSFGIDPRSKVQYYLVCVHKIQVQHTRRIL